MGSMTTTEPREDFAETDHYAWIVEGEFLQTGTLADYASDLGHAQGTNVDVSGLVQLVVDGDAIKVEPAVPSASAYETDDDWRHVYLQHAGHAGDYRIDLRA
jgi:hypothetical protein